MKNYDIFNKTFVYLKGKCRMVKKKKRNNIIKYFRKPIIVLIALSTILIILNITNSNYVVEKVKNKTNLIISNINVTKNLKQDLYVQNGIIYMSVPDIYNFFDNTIIYDNAYNMLITCSNEKVASLPIENNEIQINSSKVKLKSGAIQKENIYYIPISELGNVYNSEGTNTVIIDYLNKEYAVSKVEKNTSIKYKPQNLSKTLTKVKEGESIVVINNSETSQNGWTKVRTTTGILGYIKTNKISKPTYIRETMEENVKKEGEITWSVFSSEYNIKDRTATLTDGTKVLSPTFFNLRDEAKGKLNVLIENNENKYINWAHKNGYEIWASVSNRGYKNTTANALEDYKNRQYMIEQIVDYIITYKLDGINISFTNIQEENSNDFTRFLTELQPRLNEIGATLSVDTLEASSGIVQCIYKK